MKMPRGIGIVFLLFLLLFSNAASALTMVFFGRGGILVLVLIVGVQIVVTCALFLAALRISDRRYRAVKQKLDGIISGKSVLSVSRFHAGDAGDTGRSLENSLDYLLGSFGKATVLTGNLWRKDYELSQDIFSTTNAIREGIGMIANSADSLEGTTEKLDREIIDSRKNVDSIRQSLEEARKVFQNQSSAIEESSASIEQLITSIRNIGGISEAKKSSLKRLSDIARKGKSEIDSTMRFFSSIGEATKLMTDLVNVITEVADKTNLLSMNAAIQAARAGENGRGFAVVAGEIKKLAESSRNSAATISSALDEIGKNIDRTVTETSVLKVCIDDILASVEETTSSMQEILDGMTEMSQGTSEISSALSVLVDTAAEANRHADSIYDAAGNLQSSLGNIESHSRTNLSEASTISGSVHHISDSIQLLSRISNDSSKNLTSMRSVLDRTKTGKRFVCDYIPPNQYIEDDEVTGRFAEIVRLMCREAGEEPFIEFMPWDKALALGEKTPGVYIMTILRTAEREKRFRWIGPVITDHHFLYRLSERTDISIGSEGDLKNYRVGCVENNYAWKYFIDHGVPEKNIIKADIHTVNVQNLLLGKVDLIPLGDVHAVYQLKSMNRPLDTLTQALKITGIKTDLYLATCLDTPDDDFKRFEAAMEKIMGTEEFEGILKKYGS